MLCSELLKEGAGKAAHSSDGNTKPRQGSDLFNNSCMQGPEMGNIFVPGNMLEHVIPHGHRQIAQRAPVAPALPIRLRDRGRGHPLLSAPPFCQVQQGQASGCSRSLGHQGAGDGSQALVSQIWKRGGLPRPPLRRNLRDGSPSHPRDPAVGRRPSFHSLWHQGSLPSLLSGVHRDTLFILFPIIIPANCAGCSLGIDVETPHEHLGPGL